MKKNLTSLLVTIIIILLIVIALLAFALLSCSKSHFNNDGTPGSSGTQESNSSEEVPQDEYVELTLSTGETKKINKSDLVPFQDLVDYGDIRISPKKEIGVCVEENVVFPEFDTNKRWNIYYASDYTYLQLLIEVDTGEFVYRYSTDFMEFYADIDYSISSGDQIFYKVIKDTKQPNITFPRH